MFMINPYIYSSAVKFTEEFNSFDTGIWTNVGGYTLSGGIYTQTGNGSSNRKLYSNNAIASGDFDISFYASITATNLGGHGIGLTTTSGAGPLFAFYSVWNINSTNTYISHNSANVANLTNYHNNTYHTWRIKRVGSIWTYYIDGVQKYTGTGPTTDVFFYCQNYDNGENINIDWIRDL